MKIVKEVISQKLVNGEWICEVVFVSGETRTVKSQNKLSVGDEIRPKYV